jgi:hypothetical protein
MWVLRLTERPDVGGAQWTKNSSRRGDASQWLVSFTSW